MYTKKQDKDEFTQGKQRYYFW